MTTALTIATACGTSDPAPAAPQPPAPATTTGGATSAAPPAADTQGDQAWSAVDPCVLLTPAQLKPFLATTPAKPSRVDAEGRHICAWGDGEFRSVRLSVWPPKSTEELAEGAIRQEPVAGHDAQVVTDSEYTCEMQVGVPGMAVNLQTVSTDKIKLCPDTATALAIVVGRLPW
jgi:hypothetical protein